jgi:hypothetical protein
MKITLSYSYFSSQLTLVAKENFEEYLKLILVMAVKTVYFFKGRPLKSRVLRNI